MLNWIRMECTMSKGSSHPPITEVAVFSVDQVDHVYIRIGAVASKQMSLRLIGKWQKWNEYRIIGWMTHFPDCLLTVPYCESGGTLYSYTCFNRDNQYGYFCDTTRIGYSVKEKSAFFINYLGPPTVWEPSNHCSGWPPQFRVEVWHILLACKRLGGVWRNVRFLIIGQLAGLWR